MIGDDMWVVMVAMVMMTTMMAMRATMIVMGMVVMFSFSFQLQSSPRDHPETHLEVQEDRKTVPWHPKKIGRWKEGRRINYAFKARTL